MFTSPFASSCYSIPCALNSAGVLKIVSLRRFLSSGIYFDPALSRLIVLPLFSELMIKFEVELTRDKRDGIQPLPPLVRDQDVIAGIFLVGGRVSHRRCIFDECLGVLMLNRVHHVEEIGPLGETAFGVPVREVLHKLAILLHEGP